MRMRSGKNYDSGETNTTETKPGSKKKRESSHKKPKFVPLTPDMIAEIEAIAERKAEQAQQEEKAKQKAEQVRRAALERKALADRKAAAERKAEATG